MGHNIGSGKIEPIASKIECIDKIPPPKTKKQLRGFLGSVGFFRRFIYHFAEVAAPLTDLLKGKRSGDISSLWSEQQQKAFESLKKALTSKPILKAPEFDMPFELYTDASNLGISAVLTQTVDQVPHPIAFYSRKLVARERNYSTIEKELLAIVAGIQHFRIYVSNGKTVINSDHNPLVWLSNSKTTNQRLLRWALCLSEYDLAIKHIKGSNNNLADFLSRSL